MKDYENMAIITIKDGIVHLDTTFNPDGGVDDPDRLQQEHYPKRGWNEPQCNPLLAEDFWGVWDRWNAMTVGGVAFDDEATYGDAARAVDCLHSVRPDEIAGLDDGEYVVVA